MYDISEPVRRWLAAGTAVHVAQVVATRGFGSSDPSAALAWTDTGEVTGGLLATIDDALIRGTPADGRLTELTLSDADAGAAGLSCGGVATVFVQHAAAYPADFWAQLERREPLCLVTEIIGDQPARTEGFSRATVRDAVQIAGADGAPRLFARGTSATTLTSDGDRSLVVITLWPPTRLLVVGDGSIADALADVGALLGWTSTCTADGGQAIVVAATLTESDAVVVLSHDRQVDVPALAAALAGRAGYVGALGSRATQAARRDGLATLGVDTEDIHGPAGLDVDAHTPGEIAVSIAAEILAVRSGTSGGSISQRQGPVHVSGVNAPPPRYAST